MARDFPFLQEKVSAWSGMRINAHTTLDVQGKAYRLSGKLRNKNELLMDAHEHAPQANIKRKALILIQRQPYEPGFPDNVILGYITPVS